MLPTFWNKLRALPTNCKQGGDTLSKILITESTERIQIARHELLYYLRGRVKRWRAVQSSRYTDWLRSGRDRSSNPSSDDFSVLHLAQLRSTQPPIKRPRRIISSGIKRPARQTDHSPPTSIEANNMWVCTSTPHMYSWRSVQLFTQKVREKIKAIPVTGLGVL
jgi:hypothetical protein